MGERSWEDDVNNCTKLANCEFVQKVHQTSHRSNGVTYCSCFLQLRCKSKPGCFGVNLNLVASKPSCFVQKVHQTLHRRCQWAHLTLNSQTLNSVICCAGLLASTYAQWHKLTVCSSQVDSLLASTFARLHICTMAQV